MNHHPVVPIFDIDFYNICVSTQWIATLNVELRICSSQQHFRLLRLGSKKGAMMQLEGAVQLIDEPPIFIYQAAHDIVLKELRRRGHVLYKPSYKPASYRRDENDPDDTDGDASMAPVPFAIATSYIGGPALAAALLTVEITAVRTTRFNGKTPIGDWISMFADYLVTNAWSKSCLDLSCVVSVGDKTQIPLVGGTGVSTRVMELCGALGRGHGSLFLNSAAIGGGGGAKVNTTTVYSSRLVHHLKQLGMKAELPATDTVRQAAEYRRKLVVFLDRWISLLESPGFDALNELRFETRVTIKHAIHSGDWTDLVRAAGTYSLAGLETMYELRQLKCSLLLISVADYVGALRNAMARLCMPKLRVGFSLDSQTSINAVKLRFADLHAQAGLHPGLRISNCINRAAVQLLIDPSVEQVDAGGSIFDDDYVFAEPQTPQVAPAPLVRARRAHVLFIGGRMNVAAMTKYLQATQQKERYERFDVNLPPVPFTVDEVPERIQVQGRLQQLFGDEAQQHFAQQHPALTPDDALRLQMFMKLNIIPKGVKQTIKRNGKFVVGCTHASVELLINHMMAHHQDDWQTFDMRSND